MNNLKKLAKEKFYNNLEISLSDFHTNDKKKFWQVIRHFVKNNNSSGNIPSLVSSISQGQTIHCYTDNEKAECLNEYFTSISTVNDGNVQLPIFQLKTQSSISNITCTASEISYLIEI